MQPHRVWNTALSLALAIAYDFIAQRQTPQPTSWVGDTWPGGHPATDTFWQAVTRSLQPLLGQEPLPQNAHDFHVLMASAVGAQAEDTIRQQLLAVHIGESALQEWCLFETLHIVKRAVNRLRRWLEISVEQWPYLPEDDWWDYARLIALMLVAGKCPCGRAHCATQHALAQWDPQERSLVSYIYRAVIGPAGLRARSVEQGMLFPLLRQEHGLLAVKVGFKQCPANACGRLYEGNACPDCRRAFDPATIPVIGRDWLVLQGVYIGDLRVWACGAGRKAHYYAQQACREDPMESPHTFPQPSYRLRHGRHAHDQCPLQHCPRHDQRHGQRGTTLWRRAVFARGEPAALPPLPLFLHSVIKGAREAVSSLQGWQRVWVLLLARDDPVASPRAERWQSLVHGDFWLTDDELLTLADHLFHGRETGALVASAALEHRATHARRIAERLKLPAELHVPRRARELAQFETALQAHVAEQIVRALDQSGIHDKERLAWLRAERTRLAAWPEDTTHDT